MKLKQVWGIIPILMILTFMSNVNAQDWPQYLGPDGNSSAKQQGILQSWPEAGPEVLWSVDVGIGYGGPVVQNGKVYLLDRDDNYGDYLRCFDLVSGEELWKFGYEAPGSVMFPGSRSVPTLDGDRIYSAGPYGDLYCVDITTRKPVWHKNLWKDFGGGDIPTWAITQSPLVFGGLLIVASQAPQAGVVAYDKMTGAVKWKTPPLGNVGYVSPAIVKVSGEDHVVMISASSRGGGGGKVVGIQPLSGKILWEYDNWQCRIPIPNVTDAGNGKMLIIGGYEAGAAMIQVAKNSDGTYAVNELFKTLAFGSHTKPAVLHDGYFYAMYSTNEKRDGLVCMNMDGEVMWKTRREPAFDKGSMILVEDMILATDGARSLYLIEPNPTAFKPIANAELLTAQSNDDPRAARFGVQNWAPIALADGNLLIRDQSKMVCVRVAKEGS